MKNWLAALDGIELRQKKTEETMYNFGGRYRRKSILNLGVDLVRR